MKYLVRIVFGVLAVVVIFIATNLVLYYELPKETEDTIFFVDTILFIAIFLYMLFNIFKLVQHLIRRLNG